VHHLSSEYLPTNRLLFSPLLTSSQGNTLLETHIKIQESKVKKRDRYVQISYYSKLVELYYYYILAGQVEKE